MKIHTFLKGFAGSAVAGSLLVAGTAFAQTAPVTAAPVTGNAWGPGMHRGAGHMPGVFGTVASVNGTSLTVTSKVRPGDTTTTPTTYTIDGTSATVTKDNVASSMSAIAVGDTVMVQGTVTGTNVVATKIRDGVPAMGMRGGKDGPGMMGAQSSFIIKGNGQPVVGGSVTAVSGATLTLSTAQGGIVYSVDATQAVVDKGNATSSVSAIVVGDKVVVQGSVSGTSITATSIIDQGSVSAVTPGTGPTPHPRMGGFMGAIGGFFQHLFGFF